MEYVFTFLNTHNAIKSEQILLKSEIPVLVMPLPVVLAEGCGIGLRVEGTYLKQSRQVLEECGILVENIYQMSQNANKREYKPWNP